MTFLLPIRLVCTALYHDGDSERKYLPQFFKFMVANPLSVRTKVTSPLIVPIIYDLLNLITRVTVESQGHPYI